jgi:serine/threonine protein kinase
MTKPVEKLGQLLIKQGLLTPAQLADCLRESARGTETQLSDVIVSRGLVDRETMNRALQSLSGPDWVSIADPATPAETPVPPEVLEARKDPKRVMQKYTLIEELGRGGMAVVYKAWDDFLKNYVALKLIRSQDIGIADAAREGEIQEFLREARTAIKLSHPHIVRVFELGCHDDRYFLSMEFVDGKNLEAMLHPNRRQNPWQEFFASPRRFLVILRDVASALHHAHAQNPPIVHRDVKPQNILVDGKGRACVVDFGLAKEMKSGSTLTVSGIVKGTPCYMAPEQALGRSGQGVDARTDVWALGAILYECLAGIPPFTGPTQREILNKVVHEEPTPPSALHKNRGSGVAVPAALEKVCLKALEKDKTKRYASAEEFAHEIDRYLGGGTVRARGVAGYERAWRRAARNKAVVLSVAAAIVMSIVAVVALMRKSEPEKIVEKVVVEGAADARVREATERIQSIASEMRFDQARRAYQELIASMEAGKEREALKGELEEIRLQQALIRDLTLAIREGPRSYVTFALRDRTLDDVRVLDATNDVLIVRHADRGLEIPWVHLAPRQFASMAYEFRQLLGSEASLGFISWCLHHKRPDEALVMARDLRGKPGEAMAKRLLSKAGLELAPERTPEPVAKEPDPTPEPEQPLVTKRVEPPPEAPSPAKPPASTAASKIKVPAPPAWTYQPEWKHHGIPLASELSRRGWDDLAEEIALNLLSTPSATERDLDQAQLLRARIWSDQASRAENADEMSRKQAWAIELMEGLLGRSIDREIRSELTLLYGERARYFLATGKVGAALSMFESQKKNAKARVDRLERDGKAPRDEWVNAKLAQALVLFTEAEAFRSVPSRADGAWDPLQRMLELLDSDVLWETDGTAAGLHAYLLRTAATIALAKGDWSWPVGGMAWLEDPALLKSEAGRWLVPRALLLEIRGRESGISKQERGNPEVLANIYLKKAKYIEDQLKRAPLLKEGEIGRKILLQLARAHVRSGKSSSAIAILRSILTPDCDVSTKSVAALILKEAGTTEAKKILTDLNVNPASELPSSFDFLLDPVPAATTPVLQPVTSSYAQRLGNREAGTARGGGTRATEAAVISAIKWLARHQGPDGGWAAETFWNQCSGVVHCGGPGERDHDTGLTGLAVLALLGAGYSHVSPEEYVDPATGRTHKFGDAVRKGLQYLIARQDPEGCVGERGMKYMYNHTICSLALIEAYGMTGSLALKVRAQKAVDFTIAAQNPGKGWRYSAKCGDNDSSVSGWAIQMLRAAELAELSFPKSAYEGALAWFHEASELSGYNQVGYNARSTGKVYNAGKNEQFDNHATMTAAGVLSRLFMGRRKGGDSALQGFNLLVSDLPDWKTNKIDFYYWYYSSVALFQYDGPDGPAWKKWNEPMKNALVPNQKTAKDGCRNGSWDPDNERWGADGGRVYATAINALTLETYYRCASKK